MSEEPRWRSRRGATSDTQRHGWLASPRKNGERQRLVAVVERLEREEMLVTVVVPNDCFRRPEWPAFAPCRVPTDDAQDGGLRNGGKLRFERAGPNEVVARL